MTGDPVIKSTSNRVSVRSLRRLQREGTPIVAVTAYDYPFARLADAAGFDIILVGDSLGMTVLGYETTLPVELDDILRHTAAVARGTERAMVVADMPFMSYQLSVEQALTNAGRLMKEAGAQGVKVEGGEWIAPTVHAMVEVGIPVMGHVGLLPQSVFVEGGYRIHGRERADAETIMADARALDDAGAFAIVLEGLVPDLAKDITSAVKAPTIGIGAGLHCNGQIQVLHDLLGLFEGATPAHARTYAQLGDAASEALKAYRSDVLNGTFPGPENVAQ